LLQDYGVEKDAGGDEGVALRATFIISDKGIVRHAEIADLPIGRNPEETVRLVQAFKFADEHGEVSASLLLHSHAMRPHLTSRAARAVCRLPRGSPAARFAPLHGSLERRR
jgi:alkyl hydroperoxide reductase subunit AhpC